MEGSREDSWQGIERGKRKERVIYFYFNKKIYLRVGEWAQWQEALVLAEGPALIPSIRAYNHM